jgi:predicted DNA-binding transcriptional regulator AlpA
MIPKNYITIKQYCEAYQVTRRTYYHRFKNGVIPKKAIKLLQGRKYIDTNHLT